MYHNVIRSILVPEFVRRKFPGKANPRMIHIRIRTYRTTINLFTTNTTHDPIHSWPSNYTLDEFNIISTLIKAIPIPPVSVSDLHCLHILSPTAPLNLGYSENARLFLHLHLRLQLERSLNGQLAQILPLEQILFTRYRRRHPLTPCRPQQWHITHRAPYNMRSDRTSMGHCHHGW